MYIHVCILQLLELESTKQSLENVNDSLRLQLDEMREEQGVEAEDMMKVRGELEDAQTALAAAEEDVKTYQQDLSDTQVQTCVLHSSDSPKHVSVLKNYMYMYVRVSMLT